MARIFLGGRVSSLVFKIRLLYDFQTHSKENHSIVTFMIQRHGYLSLITPVASPEFGAGHETI